MLMKTNKFLLLTMQLQQIILIEFIVNKSTAKINFMVNTYVIESNVQNKHTVNILLGGGYYKYLFEFLAKVNGIRVPKERFH